MSIFPTIKIRKGRPKKEQGRVGLVDDPGITFEQFLAHWGIPPHHVNRDTTTTITGAVDIHKAEWFCQQDLMERQAIVQEGKFPSRTYKLTEEGIKRAALFLL